MDGPAHEVSVAMATTPPPASRGRWWSCLALEGFNRLTATFRDPAQEAAYQQNFINHELPRERIIMLLMGSIYALYGFLDLLTIKEHLGEILAIRWLVALPIGIAPVALSFIGRIKRYSAYLFTFGAFVSGISIVWMISILPSEGAPPYVIGVVVVFIFASLSVRMPFPAASLCFIVTAAAYSYVLLDAGRFGRVEVISGHFFMISSVAIAIVANYIQEIRLRRLWRDDQLRSRNAKLVEELMIEATAADQSKINFLSILSHELRTPLHQIIGFAEILRGHSGSDLNAFVGEILASARQLLSRISKMLRYADATAGRIFYDTEDYSVSEIIELTIGQFAARAAEKEIVISADNLAKGVVRVDQASTTYALGHLLENAINASPRGASIRIRGAVGDDGSYALEIVDQGPGMTDEQIRAAFSPFSQIGDAKTRAAEGVGLGLPLAQKILTDQGAKMRLFSTPGAGLKARVLFPARQKTEAICA